MAGTAVIDWLSFTFQGWSDMGEKGISGMVRTWLQEWMQQPVVGVSGNGLYGFEHSITWQSPKFDELQTVAVLAWGGKNQRGKIYVSINGTGCSLIEDWGCVRRIVESIKATITRTDVAVDALNGEFTADEAVNWYGEGGFNAGGRRPSYKMEGDWHDSPDMVQQSGRTFYVGRRKNGKYARIYEKGKQLGSRWSVWNRFEVEVHNVDRELPFDIITNPSAYFAGMYPCCEGLVDVGAERIKTLQDEFDISLDRLKSYLRIAYGKLIYVLRMTNRQDDESKMLDEICQQGIPRRLGKAALSALLSGESSDPPTSGALKNG